MKYERKELDRLNNEADQNRKLIRINAVTNLTGLSKSYIYALRKENLFPKSIHLVPGGTSIAWVKSEVLDWIESRIQSRDASHEESPSKAHTHLTHIQKNNPVMTEDSMLPSVTHPHHNHQEHTQEKEMEAGDETT